MTLYDSYLDHIFERSPERMASARNQNKCAPEQNHHIASEVVAPSIHAKNNAASRRNVRPHLWVRNDYRRLARMSATSASNRETHWPGYVDFAAAIALPLFVRNTNRLSAAVTRMGDAQNCSKHQIAKWSQKHNSARHHASVRSRCIARATTTADTLRKSRSPRLMRAKHDASRRLLGPKIRATAQNARCPREIETIARPYRAKEGQPLRATKTPLRGRIPGHISSRGMNTSDSRAWTQHLHQIEKTISPGV